MIWTEDVCLHIHISIHFCTLPETEGETHLTAVVNAVASNRVRTKGIKQAIFVLVAIKTMIRICTPSDIN